MDEDNKDNLNGGETGAEGGTGSAGDGGTGSDGIAENSPFNPFNNTYNDNKSDDKNDGKNDEGDDFDADDKEALEELVNKKVDQRFVNQEARIDSNTRTNEVNDFLTREGNEVFKPYADKIKEYVQSPVAKGLTLEAIARLAVDPNDMIKQGATLEKEARIVNDRGVVGGAGAKTITPSDELPDPAGMSSAEFGKAVEKHMDRSPR